MSTLSLSTGMSIPIWSTACRQATRFRSVYSASPPEPTCAVRDAWYANREPLATRRNADVGARKVSGARHLAKVELDPRTYTRDVICIHIRRLAATRVDLSLSTGMSIPIFVRSSNGTIGVVKDHRIRLTDEDITLIQSALRARAAMTTGLRRHRVERLAERLGQGSRGNPKLIFDEPGQTHEDELESDELD